MKELIDIHSQFEIHTLFDSNNHINILDDYIGKPLVSLKDVYKRQEVVNSQIVLYEIEHGHLPTSISDLTSGEHPYLTEKQITCPSGLKISIVDGQAYAN